MTHASSLSAYPAAAGINAISSRARNLHLPANILIVEDEPEIREPLTHSLKLEGYRILEAEDGLAGLLVE